MVRTQVYLTEKERSGLAKVANARGKKPSELIREAVDRFLDAVAGHRRDEVLRQAAGLWRNRRDLPGAAVRRSWDRT